MLDAQLEQELHELSLDIEAEEKVMNEISDGDVVLMPDTEQLRVGTAQMSVASDVSIAELHHASRLMLVDVSQAQSVIQILNSCTYV